jgi:ABC-type transport system involved in cytochrome bd biosynthesis fused ATPase/permease subunit
VSQETLAALRNNNALAQTLTFEQLEAYHVDFDSLTGARSVEHELRYWSTRAGRVAVIGDSGAGKSSVMASVLGPLARQVRRI